MVNPMKELNAEDVSIPMNLPEGAEDVKYFFYDIGDGSFYETQFQVNGKKAFTRAKATAETSPVDFSGLNYDFTEADAEVDGKAAKVYTCDSCGFAAWVDVVPGVAYNVGYNDAATAEEIIALANACAYSLQGEVG